MVHRGPFVIVRSFYGKMEEVKVTWGGVNNRRIDGNAERKSRSKSRSSPGGAQEGSPGRGFARPGNAVPRPTPSPGGAADEPRAMSVAPPGLALPRDRRWGGGRAAL